MPRPAHGVITWKGVFGTAAAPNEEWQFSLRYTGPSVPSLPTSDPNSWTSLWVTHLAVLHQPDIRLVETEHARVGADGKWLRGADGSYTDMTRSTTDQPGTTSSATTYMPTFMACCVSLVSARPDATGKGRIYLPPVYFPLGGDRRWSDANASQITTVAKNFIGAVRSRVAAAGGSLDVVSSKGYASPITHVRVGRVPDTQRRRRGDLIEGYATAAL